MATNDKIVQGEVYIFRQNIGGPHGGLGRNEKLDNRLVKVIAKNCIGSGGVHEVEFDDKKRILAMDRELHEIK